MMMLSRSSVTTVARAAARRNMSTQAKMHKSSGNWETMKSQRKIDHDDLHVRFSPAPRQNVPGCLTFLFFSQTVFHPPFNKGPVWAIVGTVWLIGVGSMQYGYMHQQYKQGFWK